MRGGSVPRTLRQVRQLFSALHFGRDGNKKVGYCRFTLQGSQAPREVVFVPRDLQCSSAQVQEVTAQRFRVSRSERCSSLLQFFKW